MESSEQPAPGPKPANPARFVPFVVLGIVFTVMISVFGSLYCTAEQEKRLLRAGEPAVAEIIDLVDTGDRYNYNPEIEFTLRVTPSEGPPFEGKSKTVLDAVQLQTYRVGAKLDVRYSTADPQQIAIVGLVGESAAPAKAETEPGAPDENESFFGLGIEW